jgi:uncharacterized protein (UPF0212 family)
MRIGQPGTPFGGHPMPFEWLKFLHIITVVASVVLAEGGSLALVVAARRRNVEGLRQAVVVSEIGERLAGPLLALGIALGVAAALAGAIDLAAPWLVASYGLVAVAFSVGAFPAARYGARLRTTAAASPIDAPSPELAAVIDSLSFRIILSLPPLLLAAIFLLMVVKPQLW